MRVRNAINGVESDIPDEIWQQVKDEKHVKNTLYPIKKADIPPEVLELQEKKAKKIQPVREPDPEILPDQEIKPEA